MKMKKEPTTQGSKKMVRYLQDLIRNVDFRTDLKRAMRKKRDYSQMSDAEKKKDERMMREHDAILDLYEQVKKRSLKLDKYFGWTALDETIAESYGLDIELMHYAKALIEKKLDEINYYE